MVLVWVGVVLVLLSVAALLPSDRVPTWLSAYVVVGIACAVLVVLAALLT
jgi:hypothetical protein